MSLRETMRSWKIALFLTLITMLQIVVISLRMSLAGS